jgi:ribonuclease P protein component
LPRPYGGTALRYVKRRQRLRTDADFQRVRGGKRSWAHPLLVLYTVQNAQDHWRVGISVGKRVARQAVLRNRVRRRVGEAVRLRGGQLAAGHDLLFIARGPSAQAGWAELREAVDVLLRKARLLQDE